MFHFTPQDMENTHQEGFNLIGIAVRTANAPGKAELDIPALWHRFMDEQVAAKIPGRVDTDILCAYTDYVSDATEPYTTVLGCRVESLDQIPAGMVGLRVAGGPFQRRSVRGDLAGGAVITAWMEIWQADLPRAYTTDYEVYGEFENPHDSEMHIYIALK